MENCYKCGKPFLKTPCCPDCGLIPIIEGDYSRLIVDRDILLNAIICIAKQEDLTGNWAVKIAKQALKEINK